LVASFNTNILQVPLGRQGLEGIAAVVLEGNWFEDASVFTKDILGEDRAGTLLPSLSPDGSVSI